MNSVIQSRPAEWDECEPDFDLCQCDSEEYGKMYTMREKQENRCSDCGLPLFHEKEEQE